MASLKVSSSTRSLRFARFRKISKIIGAPLTNSLSTCEKVAMVVYPLAVYLYCALFFSRKFNLQKDTDDLIYATTLAYIVPRFTLMRLHRRKLADLLTLMEAGTECKIKTATKLWSDLQRVLSVVTHLPFALAATVYLSYILDWLLKDKKDTLPFGALPMWTMNSNYAACFTFQITIFALFGTDFMLWDTIKLCIMLELRMQFVYLRQSVEQVLNDAKEEEVKNSMPWRCQKKKLKNITLYHKYIAGVASETEAVFNKCVLFSFVNLSFLTCFMFVGIANAPLFTVAFWKRCMCIAVSCGLYFGDCYFTQAVITENEALSLSCYNIDFVGTDLRFQKALLFLMMRTQKTVRFTIGKFAPVGVATVVTILKATYSYFALLQSRSKQ